MSGQCSYTIQWSFLDNPTGLKKNDNYQVRNINKSIHVAVKLANGNSKYSKMHLPVSENLKILKEAEPSIPFSLLSHTCTK